MSCYKILQNLCINEEVLRLGSIQRINDRCMEMQKNKHGERHFCGRIALLTEIILTSGFIDFSRESLFHLSFHFVEKHHHEEGIKRKRGPAKSVCPYYKASALQQMRDVVLGAVHDIEQLLKLGRETHSCPYYATRLAIPPAQVTESICQQKLLGYCISPTRSGFHLMSLWFVYVGVAGCVTLSNGAS